MGAARADGGLGGAVHRSDPATAEGSGAGACRWSASRLRGSRRAPVRRERGALPPAVAAAALVDVADDDVGVRLVGRGDDRRRLRPQLGPVVVGVAPAAPRRLRPRRPRRPDPVARGAIRRPLPRRHGLGSAEPQRAVRRPAGVHVLLGEARVGRGHVDAERLLRSGGSAGRPALRRRRRSDHRRRPDGHLQQAGRPARPRLASCLGGPCPAGSHGPGRGHASQLATLSRRHQQRRGLGEPAGDRGRPDAHGHRRRGQRRVPHRGKGARRRGGDRAGNTGGAGSTCTDRVDRTPRPERQGRTGGGLPPDEPGHRGHRTTNTFGRRNSAVELRCARPAARIDA